MLPGQSVNSEKDIKPFDISNDGSMTYFIGPDYSFIIAKKWNMDGTIQTIKFVREETEPDEDEITIADLADQLDRIENLLTRRTRKKEGIIDG